MAAATTPEPPVAFINVPYSKRYERVYLAFIAGLSRSPSSLLGSGCVLPCTRGKGSDYEFHDSSLTSVPEKIACGARLTISFLAIA